MRSRRASWPSSGAQAQDVKDLASHEVHDHLLVGGKLKLIYTAAGLKYPLTLNQEFQQRLAKLKSVSTENFDAAYVEDMKQIHDKDEKLFAQEAKDGSGDFKSFAAETDKIVKTAHWSSERGKLTAIASTGRHRRTLHPTFMRFQAAVPRCNHLLKLISSGCKNGALCMTLFQLFSRRRDQPTTFEVDGRGMSPVQLRDRQPAGDTLQHPPGNPGSRDRRGQGPSCRAVPEARVSADRHGRG